MLTLKIKFDKVGKFQPTIGPERECLLARYIIGKPGDDYSGAIYIPKGVPFPEEGILLKPKED